MFDDFIKKVSNNYSKIEHSFFWLAIILNFFALFDAINTLQYLPIWMPILQGLYLGVCLLAYIKGYKLYYIVVPLFIIALAFYLSSNIV